MNRLKNEHALLKEAIRVGTNYIEARKLGKFDATDSADAKMEFIYRALVHDGLVQPLAKDKEDKPGMRHKLALWISRQLPDDHPLK